MIEFLPVDFMAQLGWSGLILICLIVLVTSSIHGATGVAGGFLLSAALAPIIGVKPIVPVMSVALLISHSTRVILNRKDFNHRVFLYIILPALPCIIIVALLYGQMSETTIAIFLGLVILMSVPIRHWGKSNQIKVGKKGLSGAGILYGSLSGASIGPGMLLVPFILGYGITKEGFVATLAAIALVTNITRVMVFNSADLLMDHYFYLGILIGVLSIPGNWFGRVMLRRMNNNTHGLLIDILSVLGALNFFYLAL